MNKSNIWKMVVAVLIVLAVVLVFIWGPLQEGAPDPGPDIKTPSMENIPPPGAKHLSIEVEMGGGSGEAPAEE